MEEKALVPAGIVAPLVTVDEAVEAWKGYLRLCDRLLDENDYAEIRKRKFRTKSGWRKLARAFNITDEIWEKEILRDAKERVIFAEFTVRASAPNGRAADGWGSCTIAERAHEDDKLDSQGKVICPGPCDGRKHFSNPDHDVPATAHTRAKNRAISDLIGAGEVSAEEMQANSLETGELPKRPHKRRKRKQPSAPKPDSPTPIEKPSTFIPGEPTKAEWKWLNQELRKAGVSQSHGLVCLGTPSMTEWLKANPTKTLEDALIEILAVAGVQQGEEAETT